MGKKIYLDNASTTCTDKRVWDCMSDFYLNSFGNASSMHSFGTEAKSILRMSRRTIAECLEALPEEIYFTSSGTESNNWAIKGIAQSYSGKSKHFIISRIEHDSILNTINYLTTLGHTVSYLPVDEEGIISIADLEKMIRPDTLLVSVMHVNNEIGTIQPIEEIGRICKRNNTLFHSDACQSFGKIPIRLSEQHVDLLTLNAHKIHGPKGIGALYARKGIQLFPLLHGGGQEGGKRSSTENIPAIAGFAKAVELCMEEMYSERLRIGQLNQFLVDFLKETFEDFYLNGHSTKRIANNLNFSFHGLEGETIRLLLLLDDMGIAVSAGSACSSNDKNNSASHVLQAIGRSQFEARGGIRVSFGRFTTLEDINAFAEALKVVVGQLNSIFS